MRKVPDLTSKRSSSAMNMPGMTMSPRPSIAKLLAASPFSSKSCGNTTTTHSLLCFRPSLKNTQSASTAATTSSLTSPVFRNYSRHSKSKSLGLEKRDFVEQMQKHSKHRKQTYSNKVCECFNHDKKSTYAG